MVATSLKREAIPFGLAGGYAVWARGGPESQPTKELLTMGKNAKTASAKASGKASAGHRKTKAALAAGAVASTVAATAAYRRHRAQQPHGAGTPPL